MSLSNKQQGVIKGMGSAMLMSIVVISAAILYDPFHYSNISQISQKLAVLGLSLVLPTLFLIASIGRLAKYRFLVQKILMGVDYHLRQLKLLCYKVYCKIP
ncbi:hypothetical protein [Photobacterium aquimaris]|uniref:hypothetical protein n=1 Tax=Photobacterium aquimaris TaxID=512643 RepID=UPI000B2D16A0|nr:hypothetical protein [Photobacterium aquimaris]